MIEVNDLSLILNKTNILQNINLTLEEGLIYGFVGNNGCGKTMLMKCICGFVHPTKGKVIADGLEIGIDTDYLKNAGVIIETPGFISYYSGLKNLKMLASMERNIDEKRIREVMIQLGLNPDNKLPVRKYSLGMRQRLGIAQAIMENPKYLILDEPMNGLDRGGVIEIRNLLKQLKNDGRMIVIASHNPEDINELCDVIIEIDKGMIINTVTK